MANKKELLDSVNFIFAEFKKDGDGLRALRRINIAQINFAKRHQKEEARLIESLKKFVDDKGVRI